MTTKSKMREAMICVIVLIAAFVWAIKELSKGIDQKTFLKKNPKILQILLKIGQNFQDALKTLKLKYVNINSLSEKDILISDTFRKDHQFYIRVADIDIESISKDCGCEGEDYDLNKKAESIVSGIYKDINKMFDLLDDYKNGDLMDVWFDDYTVTLVIKLKSLKSVKDSEEKNEALKIMPVKENVFMDYDMIYEVFSDYIAGEAINESEQDNYVLMENCIDEQVLQEMHFSKKDLQDPATIDKILKRKGAFENVIKYTAFLFSALNFAAGIVVKVKLDKDDVTGSGGIGAATTLILETILVFIHGVVKDIPAKQYAKNIEKYKRQIQELIDKMEKMKEKNPEDSDKYQKVIDNCKSVLAEFDRRDKEAKNKALQDKADAIESLYYDLRDWWNTKDTIFGHTGSGNDYDAFQIAQAYSMQESTIIDKFIENATRRYTIMKPDDYYCIIGEENVEKARKEFHDSDLIVMSSDDEDTKFIVKNTKRVYETDCDTYWSSKVYEFREKIDQEGLKEFDKIHGFYKFSKCPDAVKQKDFLEELNKKSSVKESTDMVVNINESLFKRKEMSPLEQIEDMYKKFKAWWNKPHTLESLPGQKHSGITAGADLADALTYDSFQIAEAYGITETQIATRFIEKAPKYTTIIDQENYKKMYSDQGFNVPKMEAVLKSEDLYNIVWDGDDFLKYVSSKTKKVYEVHESEGNENSFKPSKIYTGFYFKINKEALKEFDAKYGFYKFSKCPEGDTKKSFIDSLEGKSNVKESTDIVDAIDESTDIITRREFMMYRKIIKNCLSKYPSIKAASFIPENYNGVVTVPAKKYDYASKNSYDFTIGHLIVSDVDKSEKSKCYADIKSELERYNSPFNIKLSIKSRKENGETIDSFVVRVSDKKPVKESVEESITEGFGIDKAQKASLSDLELSYDRKFNAFCLSVSSYSPEKLQNTLAQKQKALSDAQKEKKDAKDRYTKLAAQLKIDYLKNTIDKTNALIKKKSKAVASAAPKKKAVSESVEVLNELFWKKKQQTKQEPKKKYAPLTKEEFDKCVKIFKNTINKYPLVKKWVEYKDPPECEYGCCSSYTDYLKYNGNGVYIALIDTDFIDEDDFDTWIDDHFGKFYYDDLVKEFEKLDFVELFKDTIGPVYCIGIKSDKLIESTNEGFFDKKPKAKLHEFTEAEMSKITSCTKSVLGQSKYNKLKKCVSVHEAQVPNKYVTYVSVGDVNLAEVPIAYSSPDFSEFNKDKSEFEQDLKEKLVSSKLNVKEVSVNQEIMVIPGKEEE